MDDGGPSVFIVLFALFLLADVFIYGFGSAIANLREEDIEKKIEEDKASGKTQNNKRDARLLKYVENNRKYRNASNVFARLTNILVGICCVPAFVSAFSKINLFTGVPFINAITMIIAVLILIWIMSTFGVVIPYRLAALAPYKWATACMFPVECIIVILSPFAFLIKVTAGGILRIFGVRYDVDDTDVTEEEIMSMVTEGQEQGVLQDSEADMITNIIEFSDKQAKDIMTHRKSMVAIDGTMNLQEAVNFMLDANNSRFPVYLDNIDHIIGILHIRDAMKLLASEDEDVKQETPIRKIKGLLRQPKYVPETKNIDSLFHSMQSTKTQMVIVIDEYGQTSGLVSMEDILEEIVGNILDEYDDETTYIEPTANDGEYIIEGKTPLEDLEKSLGLKFENEEVETVNGLLISRLEHIPAENEEFNCDIEGYNFKILTVKNHMITSVLVTKLEENTEENSDEQTTASEGAN
ncbi:MAG: hemolysin family protein [Butyrivibrio sp.]|nr:hemolysin family protein [Butyrivibrio sp.]